MAEHSATRERCGRGGFSARGLSRGDAVSRRIIGDAGDYSSAELGRMAS